MPKPKKLTPEEKKFQEYMKEMEPIFRLFDGDADGKLTSHELLYFLKAVSFPLENEKIITKFDAFHYFDLQTAV